MYKKVLSLLMLSLFCAGTFVLSAQAQATAEGTVLRVAIPIPSDDTADESSSAFIGYTDEYLHELSQYTGWQYELIPVSGDYESGLDNILDMLRTGEADLAAPMVAGQTENGIYYSQSSYLTTTLDLQIPNAVYRGNHLEDTVRVAIVSSNGQKASADAFFAKNEITPQYVECRNVAEQIEKVRAGQADVMLNATMEYIPDMSVIARFAPQELFFAASDPALIQELDRANTNIMQSNVLFAQELYEKYVLQSSQTLTRKETMLIRQSDPYTVAVLDNDCPYQDVHDDTGEFEGIGVDLLQHIAQSTGLQFHFVSVESRDALQTMINTGEVQIVVAANENHSLAEEMNLTLTRSYSTAPYVLVSYRSFPGVVRGQRLALPEENGETNDENYIGTVQRYPSAQDCLDAIIRGDADYTYMDLYTARYYLGDVRYNGLEFKSQAYTPHAVCFGIAKPANPALLSILNKSINRISDTDIQQFISQNVNPEREITFRGLIQAYPLQALLVFTVVALLIAALLILLLWRKEQTRRVLHKKAMEDGLTQLYNATACRKLVTQQLHQMEPHQIGAFMIMDMDNFKQVNDGFGHQEGDRVIQEFANMLRVVLRGDSVIARIGGDEFVAFLPTVKEEENIRSICSRVREQAHLISVGEKPITISIGTVVAKAGDDYDTLYHLSDQALYQVKKRTKDHFCFAERKPDNQMH